MALNSNSTFKIAVCILHYSDHSLTERLHRQLLNAEPEQAKHIYVLDNATQPLFERLEAIALNVYWTGGLEYAWPEFAG